MKRLAIVCALLLALLLLGRLVTAGDGRGELALFDAPRGSWLATVRGDAPVTVVEERDGWRRVRVEGWVSGAPPGAAPAAGDRGSATGAASGGPRPADSAAGTVAPGATVQGVLQAAPGDPANTPGSGLVVFLLDDLGALDRDHARAGEECRAGLRQVDVRLERLNADLDKALNSSDNFREASQRRDAVRSEIQKAEQERRDVVLRCRRAADAILHRHAVQKAISDESGRFAFAGVAPGRYRVVAAETGGDRPRSWTLDCAVEGPGIRVLDSGDRSAFRPYWDLN
jgi:hypothetical protein